MEFLYPSYDVTMKTHERIMEESGGRQGMVSPSNLAYILDAVLEVGEKMYGRDAACAKAAYLLYNIINAHPFLDGNKRTAFEVARNFLRLNGWEVRVEEEETFETLISIARGDLPVQKIQEWIARNLRSLKEDK